MERGRDQEIQRWAKRLGPETEIKPQKDVDRDTEREQGKEMKTER